MRRAQSFVALGQLHTGAVLRLRQAVLRKVDMSSRQLDIAQNGLALVAAADDLSRIDAEPLEMPQGAQPTGRLSEQSVPGRRGLGRTGNALLFPALAEA